MCGGKATLYRSDHAFVHLHTESGELSCHFPGAALLRAFICCCYYLRLGLSLV